jgi:hypothetical protein
MPGLRLSSSLAVLTTLLQLRKLRILHRRSKPNFKPPEISRISFVTFLGLAYDLRHSRRFIKNDSNENQDSLNPQGVIDYAQWMIDRRGNPPRIDHLPLRHQVLASRVTITTMRFVAALKIANLIKHNSGEHQIFGCSPRPRPRRRRRNNRQKEARRRRGSGGDGGGPIVGAFVWLMAPEPARSAFIGGGDCDLVRRQSARRLARGFAIVAVHWGMKFVLGSS